VRRVARLRQAPGAVLALALLGVHPAAAFDTFPAPRVDTSLNPWVPPLLNLAAAWLETPGCRQVLFDFEDSRTGQPLAQRLAATGLTATAYVTSLSFLDGSGTDTCERSFVEAHTTVGGGTIFVCRTEFFRKAKADRTDATAILIHEVLHSLGLSENPPTPSEINRGILKRCGW